MVDYVYGIVHGAAAVIFGSMVKDIVLLELRERKRGKEARDG